MPVLCQSMLGIRSSLSLVVFILLYPGWLLLKYSILDDKVHNLCKHRCSFSTVKAAKISNEMYGNMKNLQLSSDQYCDSKIVEKLWHSKAMSNIFNHL